MPTLAQQIKDEAQRLGFTLCGISAAAQLEREARHLEEWLRRGNHGTMHWMENHFEKRTDPRKLVEGAKSVVSVIHNYHPKAEWHQPAGAPKISTYAWGEDYHHVLKHKLHRLLDFIVAQAGEVNARVFTDSAPVMDKVWAARSGLGWIGKHTNLIMPQKGSWYFIGEIIVDLELTPDESPAMDFCGTCTRCIDACPTEALEPYQIDARKCISYLTIELRDKTPVAFHDKLNGWAYGCDICQQVCPWNSFAEAATGEEFAPLSHLLSYERQDWEMLDERQWKRLTRHSAMNRVKWEKMKENLANVAPTQDPGTEP
jgi:epoxyqueuosine reductase